MKDGYEADWQNFNIDKNTEFYLLGLTPNTSRLAIKLFEHNSFGNIMKNLLKHRLDMQLSDSDKQLPVWAILRDLKAPKSKIELSPDFEAKLLQSIVKGTNYPRYMLDTVIRRAKTDHDDKGFFAISTNRVRIIKAYLTRKYNLKGELNMLNQESQDSAYNCGRLFATLEKIQCSALPGINATIKDKFFSTACSTPYLAMPRLLKLTQAHLKKISNQGLTVYYDKLLQEIMSHLNDGFPKALNMEKQGMFILGYYQQKQKFYETKTEKGDIE